jgi:hypothetical protein
VVRELMHELRGASECLTAAELAHRLGAEVGLVDDMLDNLVRMGKLERVEEVLGERFDVCVHCSGNCGCGGACGGAGRLMPRVTQYRIVEACL